MRAPRLLVATFLVAAAEGRVRIPTSERPTVADSIDMRVPWRSNYLRDHQVVGIIRPHGGERRFSKAANGFVGSEPFSRGLVWIVRREFKPLKRIRRKRPFKVRLLHMDPAAILGKLAAEEQIDIDPFEVPSGEYKGKLAVAVSLRKPKPW
eukprot:CAMPEP_0119072448 /NCGR_PEP_ID=MMETSP1178-20130426/58370_1 /TAXON_ID=33656 /ORGANISM="unid sp, Strain CCMP2000" /LENGTH=150 /DNA_ID=CAMNT_0007054449 /DNA_START=37 /DNA_END=486 /DNA_ORIENTATION=-